MRGAPACLGTATSSRSMNAWPSSPSVISIWPRSHSSAPAARLAVIASQMICARPFM